MQWEVCVEILLHSDMEYLNKWNIYKRFMHQMTTSDSHKIVAYSIKQSHGLAESWSSFNQWLCILQCFHKFNNFMSWWYPNYQQVTSMRRFGFLVTWPRTCPHPRKNLQIPQRWILIHPCMPSPLRCHIQNAVVKDVCAEWLDQCVESSDSVHLDLLCCSLFQVSLVKLLIVLGVIVYTTHCFRHYCLYWSWFQVLAFTLFIVLGVIVYTLLIFRYYCLCYSLFQVSLVILLIV